MLPFPRRDDWQPPRDTADSEPNTQADPAFDRPWMKITAQDESTGYCAWTEQLFDADGNFYDHPAGRFGTVSGLGGATTTASPARENNGQPVPKFPWYVRAERSELTSLGTVEYRFALGGSDSILAVLTAKDFNGPFIRYSWIQVDDYEVLSNPADPTSPKTIVYALTDVSGSPDDFPAFHEQNIDLVICGQGSGSPIREGNDCHCFGEVVSASNNGDGTYTWTFTNLQCGEDGSLVHPLTGDFVPCTATTPCPTGPVMVIAPTGTYPTFPGSWAELPTRCRSGGDEAAPECVVRLRRGRGDWYFIDHEPRWEFVKKRGEADGDGFWAGSLMRFDQQTQTWFEFDSHVLVTDVNAFS
jgi:hypothetical protein